MKKVILSTVLLSMLAMIMSVTMVPQAFAEEQQKHDPVAVCATTHLLYGAATEKAPDFAKSSKASMDLSKQIFEQHKDSKPFAEDIKFTIEAVNAEFKSQKPEEAFKDLLILNNQSCKAAGIVAIQLPQQPDTAKATKVSTTTKTSSAK